jgi:hypothetical protein
MYLHFTRCLQHLRRSYWNCLSKVEWLLLRIYVLLHPIKVYSTWQRCSFSAMVIFILFSSKATVLFSWALRPGFSFIDSSQLRTVHTLNTFRFEQKLLSLEKTYHPTCCQQKPKTCQSLSHFLSFSLSLSLSLCHPTPTHKASRKPPFIRINAMQYPKLKLKCSSFKKHHTYICNAFDSGNLCT